MVFLVRNTFGILAVLCCWLTVVSGANANVAHISSGLGNGFVFSSKGHCFILLPAHVAAVATRTGKKDIDFIYKGGFGGVATLVTFGGDEVDRRTSWTDVEESKDFALGLIVSWIGSQPTTCGPDWNDIFEGREHIDTKMLSSAPAKLVFLDNNGSLEVYEVGKVSKAGRHTVSGTADGPIVKGMSGSQLMVDGKPSAMLLSGVEEKGRFIRFTAFAKNIRNTIERIPPKPHRPTVPQPPEPPVSGGEEPIDIKKILIGLGVVIAVGAAIGGGGSGSNGGGPQMDVNLEAEFPRP